MIEKLNTLDCSEVATSRPRSTWRAMAVWYIAPSGPKDTPQRRKVKWATPGTRANPRNSSIDTALSTSIDTTSGRSQASMMRAEAITEITEPTPNTSSAMPVPPPSSTVPASSAM